VSPLPIPEGWEPEFAGQRPPFQPGNEYRVGAGNTLAQTHGAFSPALIEPVARELRDTILTDPDSDYLRSPRFAKRLWSYCQTEARVMRIEAWVGRMTDEEAARSDKGQTSPLELLRKWKTTAANEANKLGLDPVSWARIRKDYAVTRRFDMATYLSARRSADDSGDGPVLSPEELQRMDEQAAQQFPGMFDAIEAGTDGDGNG
jgi:hypothetical protein